MDESYIIITDHSITFLNILKISKKLENLKRLNFVLISETVRERVKRTKFWDHMH